LTVDFRNFVSLVGMQKTIAVALLTATLTLTGLGAAGCRARDRDVTTGGGPAVTGSVAPAQPGPSTAARQDAGPTDADLAGVDGLLTEVDEALAGADRSPEDAD
jgi:hypothetical protein